MAAVLALRWRKEAVIEVRTCQTTIAILPPRGYFPQDVSSVETPRPGLLVQLMNDAAMLTAEPVEKPQGATPNPSVDAPVSRPVQRTGSIKSFPILGGLYHHYARV